MKKIIYSLTFLVMVSLFSCTKTDPVTPTASIVYTNSTIRTGFIQLINKATLVSYQFEFKRSITTPTVCGTVPYGTYEVDEWIVGNAGAQPTLIGFESYYLPNPNGEDLLIPAAVVNQPTEIAIAE